MWIDSDEENEWRELARTLLTMEELVRCYSPYDVLEDEIVYEDILDCEYFDE